MYVVDTKISKELNPLKDELSNVVFQYLEITNNKINQNKRLLTKSAVACFLLNSYYKTLKGIVRIGITLNKNHYSKNSVINGRPVNRKVSYQYTRIMFDALHHHGYINLVKGGIDEWGMIGGKWQPVTFNSGYVELQPKLIELYNRYGYQPKEEDRVRKNVIIVRDEGGCDITFRMNDKLRISKTMLDGYNLLSVDQDVCNDSRSFDVQMFKVLNGKTYDKGGRNHMSGEGIQNLSKEERMKLTIGKKQTVIYDYRSFEPSIAYSMCQEVMQGDPYNINLEGYNPEVSRKLCKLFLLIMFNLKNEKGLYATLNEAIRHEFDVIQLYQQGKIPDKRIDVRNIVNVIENKHYLIRHMFYGNFHTQPSYIGSLIADYITDYFTQRGVLVLSVFDEFIIQEIHEEELKDVMNRAYEYVLGFTDNCVIRKEK